MIIRNIILLLLGILLILGISGCINPKSVIDAIEEGQQKDEERPSIESQSPVSQPTETRLPGSQNPGSLTESQQTDNKIGKDINEGTRKDFKDFITDSDIQLANGAIKEINQKLGGVNIPGPGGGYMSFGLPQENALPEDIFVYTLVKYHHEKGILPPSYIIENGIVKLGQYNIGKWKESAIRRFWVDYSTTKFLQKDIGGDENIVNWFKVYLYIKVTEKGKKDNQYLVAIVGSDEPRQRVINSWRKYDSDIADRSEQAILERDTYRVLSDAEWAIKKAAEAVEDKY